jgi:hypothetical protein
MRRLLPLGLLAVAGLALASGPLIPEVGDTPAPRSSTGLGEARLDDKDTAEAVTASLLAAGRPGTQRLVTLAMEGDLPERGRAIVGLARAEHRLADEALARLRDAQGEPQLVRTWAYAASLQRATDMEDLQALVAMQSRFPGTERAVQLAVGPRLAGAPAELLLTLLVNTPPLASTVGPLLLEAPVAELGRVMLTHETDGVRRQAAAFLASQAQQRDRADEVAALTLAQLAHDPKVDEVPWAGGALYIPAISWDRKEARALVRTLLQWHLYAKRTGKKAQLNQIGNNLRSVSLLQSAGFQNRWPDDEQLFEEWRRIAGAADVRALHAEQGMD